VRHSRTKIVIERIIVYPQRIMIAHTSAFAGTERWAHALDLLMKMSFEA